jgi:hypothetical protein
MTPQDTKFREIGVFSNNHEAMFESVGPYRLISDVFEPAKDYVPNFFAMSSERRDKVSRHVLV